MNHGDAPRLSVPRVLLRFSVPIAAFWLALAVVTNVYVPQLEKVAQAHNVSSSIPTVRP
jgi:RND superfamily putative drug exporter